MDLPLSIITNRHLISDLLHPSRGESSRSSGPGQSLSAGNAVQAVRRALFFLSAYWGVGDPLSYDDVTKDCVAPLPLLLL